MFVIYQHIFLLRTDQMSFTLPEVPSYQTSRRRFRPTLENNGTVNTNTPSSHSELRAHAESSLGTGALAKAIKLPPGEDINEWLAVAIVDIYNHTNMLYGSITNFCSPQTCPRMIATSEYEYRWQDPLHRNGQPPLPLSAPAYVETLMNWVQTFLDDESIFPTKMGVPFPKQFIALCRTILRRLIRIHAHLFCHHGDALTALGIQIHLATSLKHAALIGKEFQLLNESDFGPLSEIVNNLLQE